MKQGKYESLILITEARYQKHASELTAITKRENDLRSSVANLKEQSRMSGYRDASSIDAKRIGADVAWQAWLGTNIAELNNELARVLAQKEGIRKRVALAYGKTVAIKQAKSKMDKAIRKQQITASHSRDNDAAIFLEFQAPVSPPASDR